MSAYEHDQFRRDLPAKWRIVLAGLLLAIGHSTQMVFGQDSSVDELRRQLSSADADDRIEAARRLGQIGPLAQEAVPELSQSVDSTDLLLRYEAARSLGKIGPDAERGIGQLRTLLDDEAALLRHVAITALRRIGSPSVELRDALARRMQDDDLLANRVAAARALAEFAARSDEPATPAAIDVLIEGLRSPQPHVASEATQGLVAAGSAAAHPTLRLFQSGALAERVAAAEALAALGRSAKASGPALLASLTDSPEVLKRQIIRALPSVGADPEAAIPELRKLLTVDSREMRLSATAALGEYGERAASAAGDLAHLLGEEDALIQRTAAAALGKLGPHAASSVPQLVAALRDDDGSVTVEAAHSLSLIGPPAVTPLIALLDDAQYRNLAATLLGDIGPSAADAAAPLAELLDVPDEEVRRAAILGLAGIGPAARPVVQERLLALLREPAGNARAGAAYALARVDAQEAVPDLLELLQETTDAREQLAAAWALVMLEPSAERSEKAVPYLIMGLDDDWELVRKECVVALAALGERAQRAAGQLISLLDDPDPLVRAEACVALHQVGSGTETLVPLMVAGLDDVSAEVRYTCAFVLGSIGAEAAPGILRLKAMMNSHVEFDRTLAAWALVKIAPSRDTIRVAVPLMLRALEHARPGVRREAATVLGDFGAGQPAVREALQRATVDTDAEVRAAAQKALER